MNKVQHRPHVGRDYEQGISGRRVAIMGFSHHDDDLSTDSAGATEECLAKVIAGEHPETQFFRQISSYFGDDKDQFWSRVLFFNFLPRAVDRAGRGRYRDGTFDEVQVARERFLEIVHQHKPDMLFVLSEKAWPSLPPSIEDQEGKAGDRFLAGETFERHHYRTSEGHVVQVIGLRHPQGARKESMMQGVAAAMQLRPGASAG